MTKVLIVDDSPAQVLSLKKLIENWGYETMTANGADEALNIARQEQPNVILMDIIMPGMNGFQATRELSKGAATKNIPIIFVSRRDGEADQVWGLRQGATAYVTKPVDPDTLLTAISEAIAA